MNWNSQKTPYVASANSFATSKAEDSISLLGQELPCSIVSIPVPGVPIVVIKFEIDDPVFNTLPHITVPVMGSEYVRLPLQPGALGIAMTIDAYLGGISGLGGGVADTTQRGNLSTLVFCPIGNKGWQAVKPDVLTLYGPSATTTGNIAGVTDGAVSIQDTLKDTCYVTVATPNIVLSAVNKTSVETIDNTGFTFTIGSTKLTLTTSAITATAGSTTLTINSSGVSITGGGLTTTGDVMSGGTNISLDNHVHKDGTNTTGPPVAGT